MPISCECHELISRRSFLGGAAAVLTFAGLPGLSLAAEPGNGRLLVILLRGGMDGLFAVPPIGDPGLKGKRRHLIPDGARKLDGIFALHPALGTVGDLYGAGQALIVHSVSFPYTGRSHFQGQDIMESAADRPYDLKTGWLGRALDASGYTAVTMSLPVPLILRGKQAPESRYPTWISNPPTSVYKGLGRLWAADPDIATFGGQLVEEAGKPNMNGRLRMGQDANLGSLAEVAAHQLREADGPRVAVLDHVGFDTHASQPGEHSDKLRDVDQAIGRFRRTIGDDVWKKTLVVTVTEFGRTVAENGSWGTDHGWGTCAFVVGGALKKSGVLADWPGLKSRDLYEGRDLKATLDARALYASVVSSALGLDPEVVRRDVLSFDKTNAFEDYI